MEFEQDNATLVLHNESMFYDTQSCVIGFCWILITISCLSTRVLASSLRIWIFGKVYNDNSTIVYMVTCH